MLTLRFQDGYCESKVYGYFESEEWTEAKKLVATLNYLVPRQVVRKHPHPLSSPAHNYPKVFVTEMLAELLENPE